MAPSEAAIGLDARYPAQPPQIAVIRRTVSELGLRGGADAMTLNRIELAVSEAATNVVMHAYRDRGEFGRIQVTAHVDGDVLDVRVRDDGGGMVARPDSPGLGLGLALMAGESDHFAVSSTEGGGTEVLLRFLLAQAACLPPQRVCADERATA